MPLILAIEPDRRQAAQLTSIVRGRLHAELVLGDSAEKALAALGDRVPDLILTSALLSPRDESALGERLRALDGTAAHVQTLTIPMLAGARSRSSGGGRGGVLSALLGEKAKADGPEGCDPAVFAEQCREYLDRAAADRAQHLAELGGVPPVSDGKPATPPPVVQQAPAYVDGPPADFEYKEAAAKPSPVVDPFVWRDPIATVSEPTPSIVADPPEPEPVEPERIETVIEAPGRKLAPYTIERSETPKERPEAPKERAEPPRKRSETRKEAVVARPPVDSALREFFDATAPDQQEAPASLIAAVAAFEADEQLAASQPIERQAEPVAPQAPPPKPAPAAPVFDLDLDLSVLLKDPAPVRAAEAAARRDDAFEIYDIDDATLDAIAPLLGTSAPKAKKPPVAEVEDEPQPTISETERYTPLPDSPAGQWPTLALREEKREEKVDKPASVAAKKSSGADAPAEDDVAEWSQIIEALKRDAERAHTKRPKGRKAAKEETVAAPEPEQASAAIAAPAPPEPEHGEPAGKKRRKRAPLPVQDEWGIFDPQQCGFEALLEKLEEITSQEEAAQSAESGRRTNDRRPRA